MRLSGQVVLLAALWSGSPCYAEDVWNLVQDSKWAGKQNIFIAKEKMRLDNEGFGFTAVCDSKTRAVDMYNSREKLRYKQPIEKWGAAIRNEVSVLHTSHLNFFELNWKKGQLVKREGQNLREYTATGNNGGVSVKAVCLVSEDVVVPGCFSVLLADMYGFPACAGLPMDVTFVDNVNGKQKLLRTISAKKLALRPDLFKVPMSYKVASKGRDLILGRVENYLEDVAASLGEMEAVSKKPPKRSSK